MLVVADPEAVSFIAAHGGRLYVCGDASGPKCVKAEPPDDPSVRFEQVAAAGFLMYVEAGIAPPERWTVKFRRVPHDRVEVLWDGHPIHPLEEQAICMVEGHQWEPDPDSKEIYPVLLCQRCGRRRESAGEWELNPNRPLFH
jgi:hypothetical protein